MSEQGWREFLAATDVADWVVLHGGAMAVFRVPSLGEAVRLADAVAGAPGIDGAGVLMTIADGQLTVRLTRGIWQLEQRHVHLARAVSAVARAHGAVADRTQAQEVQLAIAGQPDAVDVGFWRAVLGYAEVGRRQRRRPARPRIHGLDAGTQPGQATTTRDARRRVRRSRAGRAAPRRRTRRRRPDRRRFQRPFELDARRPRRQPGMHMRVARRFPQPASTCSGVISCPSMRPSSGSAVASHTARVANYYDANTRRFLRLGETSSIGAIHRCVWMPDTASTVEAADTVNRLVIERLRGHVPAEKGRCSISAAA